MVTWNDYGIQGNMPSNYVLQSSANFSNILNPTWNSCFSGGSFSSGVVSYDSMAKNLSEEKKEELREKLKKQLEELKKAREEYRVDATTYQQLGIEIKNLESITDEQGNVKSSAKLEDVKAGLLAEQENVKKATKADGSFKESQKLKNLTTLNKLEIIGGAAFSGIWKLASDFLQPKTPEGKTDWGRLGMNVGMVVLAAALTSIPVAGPIASGLLLVGGLAAGGAQVVKGVKGVANVISNDNATADDLKNSVEDLTVGGVMIAGSAVGLKGMSTAAKTATGNLFADMTVNAYKATKVMVKTDLASVSKVGFGKAWGGKISKIWTKNASQEKFKAAKGNQRQSIAKELLDINHKINDPATSPKELELLKLQRESLRNTLHDMRTATTRTEWRSLKGDNSNINILRQQLKDFKTQFKNNGKVEINGQVFDASNAADYKLFNETISAMEKSTKGLSKGFNSLFKAKQKAMFETTAKGLDKTATQQYTGNQNWFARLWNTTFDIQKPTGWKWSYLYQAPCGLVKTAFNATMIPFNIGNKVCQSSAAAGYEWEHVLLPVYAGSRFATSRTKEENDNYTTSIDAAIKEIDKIPEEFDKKEKEINEKLEALA